METFGSDVYKANDNIVLSEEGLKYTIERMALNTMIFLGIVLISGCKM
jgi:hypothetical protein